ncbi:hypothetical protein [Mucilaginibacter sp. CSA2-8R]|uniref:hypothetical protein n=1 Tax=Mucilaginibacter sp. CSA2-8R TaxID=3141542 RepID=UPI00315D873E
MSFRAILSIAILAFLTITIIQNTTETEFVILGMSAIVPKTTMLTTVSVSAFLLGVLVSWPMKKKSNTMERHEDYNEQVNPTKRTDDTLSDEDRDYIS